MKEPYLADPVTLTPDMTETQVQNAFETSFIGTHVTKIPDHLAHPFQAAYLANGNAALHIEFQLTKLPPFTTVKFVVVVAYEDGIATEIISVQKGRIAL